MTAKDLINKIVFIINETKDTYTEDRSDAFLDIQYAVKEYLKEQNDSPYIEEVTTIKRYNPKFGDDKKCKCGHSYIRHFNLYDYGDELYGCKYCPCDNFVLYE